MLREHRGLIIDVFHVHNHLWGWSQVCSVRWVRSLDAQGVALDFPGLAGDNLSVEVVVLGLSCWALCFHSLHSTWHVTVHKHYLMRNDSHLALYYEPRGNSGLISDSWANK